MPLTILNVAYPFAPVGPNAVGGAEQVLSALDEAISAAGHHSIVIACDGSTTRGELVSSGFYQETLSVDLCECKRREHARCIERVLHSNAVDVIHLHGVDFHDYLPETTLPVLVTLHLPLNHYSESMLRALPGNVSLHCVSESQSRTCPSGLPLLDTIPNGIDLAALSSKHGKRNFVLTLGRICPDKGFHLAVDAAKAAEIPLLMGGEVFGYAAHARYWRDELLPRLDRKRRWIGPVNFARKRRLLTAARCLLVPSLVAETGSLVALEALACGTPVVAFPNGVLTDIVEHGKTGFLVRDVREMSEAIFHAKEIDPEKCRRAARARFSLVNTTRRYLELYERLAHRHEPAMEERHAA